jgi:NADH-quinone oxidoreductase subunit A
VRFNNRFYVIALVFVLFDVELIFLFPWATIFGNEQFIAETNGLWGWFAILEMFIFVFVLVIGLAYVWRRGYIDWIKPVQKENIFTTKIPENYYERINQKYK